MITTRNTTDLTHFQSLIKNLTTDLISSTTPPFIFLLQGDLGAGKTEAAKQIAQMFHVKQNIKSPTFTYSYEYKAKFDTKEGKLIHWDLWRLDKSNFDLSGFAETLDSNTVVIVEWWDKFKDEIKGILDNKGLYATAIHISDGNSEGSRVVKIQQLRPNL